MNVGQGKGRGTKEKFPLFKLVLPRTIIDK